jgi:hypothetical protein
MVCFVFTLSAFAQDGDKAIPLKSILLSIEKQHHVVFNYIDNEVDTFKIISPKPSLTLEEKIDYLKIKTQLSFENINNQFINIFNKIESPSTIICGYVLSKGNNLPLENVNVQLVNGNNTITNEKGYFELKNINSKEINFSYVGFTSVKISLSEIEKKGCITVSLNQEISELSNINTTHFLTSGISKELNGSFIIKPKKLGILPGLIESDVLQTMQKIPGIYSADESIASINVRGGTHDQNLFLWNGIRMYQTGHFFGLISVFNPNIAHTISIYKNGSSAFYGESVSSVVDISSNTEKLEKNSYSAGLNMINADVFAKFKINKNGFVEIAARRSINDLVKTPAYNQYFNKAFQNTTITNFLDKKSIDYYNKENFNFYDITAKYSQKIGKRDQIIIDFITINDRLSVFQSAIFSGGFQSENNLLNQKNYGGDFLWKRDWNKTNKSIINLYSSSYNLYAQKDKIQDLQVINQQNKILDNGLKLENEHRFNSKISFKNGYQFNEIGSENLDEINTPSFYRKNKNVLRIHALALEGKYNDTISKVYLTTGLRVNYIEQFNKYIVEPRLQFNYGISRNLNFEVLGEYKSQNCFQIIDLQKDYFGIEKRRWVLANNTTIPIQKSKQLSVSLSYAKNNWLFTVENFYKRVTGINSLTQGFQNQLEFLKINGEYEVIGSEILIQKKVNDFITWLSYTFNDNNYYFPDYTPSIFSNNFELDHAVNWGAIYEKNNFKIALGAKWYSGRPETTPVIYEIDKSNYSNPTIDYNLPNNTNLKSFLQVNFSTTYKWNGAKGVQYKIGLSVLNIFNRQNEINEYYRINSVSNSIEEVKTYALKRTPNLSFRVSF